MLVGTIKNRKKSVILLRKFATVLLTQWDSNFTAEIGIRLCQNRKSVAVVAINFFRKRLMLIEDSVNTLSKQKYILIKETMVVK